MFDTDTALLKIIDNVVLVAEIADDFGEASGFDVFCRLEMIRDQRDFRVVKNRTSQRFEFLNRRRCRDVIGENHVKIANDQLACLDGVKSCMFREDLFTHIHAHIAAP